jgi:hypothetical protein
MGSVSQSMELLLFQCLGRGPAANDGKKIGPKMENVEDGVPAVGVEIFRRPIPERS